MALTAIAVALTDDAPHVYAPVTVGTGDGLGAAISVSGNRTRPVVLQMIAPADWYWHQTDAQAAADMSLQPAGVPLKVKVKGSLSLYMKAGSTIKVIISALINE